MRLAEVELHSILDDAEGDETIEELSATLESHLENKYRSVFSKF